MPAKLNLKNIAIVLTGTRYPENIGAAARAMLDTTELRIREVAQRVGIEDPYYFSRLFRSLAGVSPRAFRQRRRRA